MVEQPQKPIDRHSKPSAIVRPGIILVVDDIKENRELFELRLEMKGHGVVLADDGAAALEILANQPIDLVLLDVLMPEIVRVIARSGVLTSGSSGDQVDVSYLNTVFELYSSYHLSQIIEAA